MTVKMDALKDDRGVPVSSCTAQSLEDIEVALTQFQSYFGDPTETLSRTLERDPEFVLGHVFIASALLMSTERQYLPMIQKHIEIAESLSAKANNRERLLTRAARQWMEGHWDLASLIWDEVLSDHPRDSLALQLGHLTDFYRGDSVNLRDRVGRVLGQWDVSISGYSYILGMQAFGLEECNEYDKSEAIATAALDLEVRDPWAIHALAHTYEMQGRYTEGERMYRTRENDWAPDNGFAFHNWWHLALYHLEQEDFEAALRVYDENILPSESDVSMQLLDASALLWRLHLQGINLGDRWRNLASMWSNKTALEDGYYAFNDFHAVVSFVGAGLEQDAESVLSAVVSAAQENTGVTGMMARDVGLASCKAMIAFGQQRYGDVIKALLPIRTTAHRFGGSHAQRDILTQTLIEAAIRARNIGLATNLIAERGVHKPHTPLTLRFADKLIRVQAAATE